ncbi:YqzE family protein [Ornithinibacillus sp. L9]|uniref:YqzE family protein n=1 Tax=Ornithinibacillus caprae TaxID=2678566 RepID=A0A6N8FD87_9BACI|nr:YqzE family protein [Ornithinibacillus caprae]MUK87141.1 YqzE family protein [Ornithinibacillus caprae]
MSNDYIRTMTEKFVSYIDLPLEEKRKRRETYKAKKQQNKPVNRWFGAIPLAIRISFKKE